MASYIVAKSDRKINPPVSSYGGLSHTSSDSPGAVLPARPGDFISKKPSQWRLRLEILIIGWLLVLGANLIGIFFTAYFTGQPVVVTIDTFGEHNIEVVVFPVWLALGVWLFINKLRNLPKETK